MAFKKTLVQRLFNLSRFSTPSLTRKPPVPEPSRTPDPGESAKMRRTHQRRPFFQAATSESAAGIRLFPPSPEKVAESILPFPATMPAPEKNRTAGMTVSEVRKVLRGSQVEMLRARLRQIPRDWISYGEFMEICRERSGGNLEEAFRLAKMLDDSGSVIILGTAVCLRPQQVAKAIESIVSPSMISTKRKELEQMEEQKGEIDRKADAMVRQELWAGLGYLVAQTAVFMRLTFWELSWDVMEPICFYVTSFYFMAGYAFFLRTSKEPSFEGFFQSRFRAKQLRLMKAHNFDLQRYNQLCKAFYSHSPKSQSSSSFSYFHDARLIDFHKNN